MPPPVIPSPNTPDPDTTRFRDHVPRAPAIIHQGVNCAAAIIDGRTVMELPGDSRSAEEVAELWGYLRDRLQGGAPRRRRLPAIPAPLAVMAAQAKGIGRPSCGERGCQYV